MVRDGRQERASTDPWLDAHGLSVSFGGVHALTDLDLRIRRGELVGLIGPNGAGKTTTIDALTGFVPHRGTVVLDGVDLTAAPPHRRAAAGLGRTWQSLELFDDLTVAENCRIAAAPTTVGAMARDLFHRPGRAHAEQAEGVERALDLLDLGDAAGRSPSELSLGRRKLVAVARALAGAPKLLLLDEPAAGLDSDESKVLGQRLRRVLDDEIAIFLIDHDMALVLGICDYVYVVDFGRLIAAGPPAEIRNDPKVIAAYLGGAARESAS
jgi:branched-chain amino acid transport system ATP-binding protein